jgi:RNA polymerase sigma-70 factor (ECF subfamily)
VSRQAADLERFRSYLEMLARMQVRIGLQGKLDASDVVQQTLVQALAGWADFRGKTDAELAAWLRQILARQLSNTVRDLGRQKRDHARERSLEAALDRSTCRLELFLAADQSSPSQKAQRNEQLLALADALANLPEAQREAIVLRHLERLRIEEIAQRLERTPAAIAGLLKRGLRSLRSQMRDPDSSSGTSY